MTWKDALEIAILFGIIYAALRFLQGTRGARILQGLVFLVAIGFVGVLLATQRLGLVHLDFILKEAVTISLFALVVLFQPELRRGLMRLGQVPFVGRFLREESPVVDELIQAVTTLAKDKVGALIAVQREISLASYVEGGERIDAEVRASLLCTLFHPGTPLHDGGVVIQHDRVAAAGCLFPLTDNPEVSKRLGTRHRAAIGLTEETDAVTLVVSEETGGISVAVRGHLEQGLDRDSLRRILRELLTENVKGPDGFGRAA